MALLEARRTRHIKPTINLGEFHFRCVHEAGGTPLPPFLVQDCHLFDDPLVYQHVLHSVKKPDRRVSPVADCLSVPCVSSPGFQSLTTSNLGRPLGTQVALMWTASFYKLGAGTVDPAHFFFPFDAFSKPDASSVVGAPCVPLLCF